LNATATPGLLKYPGLVVEKKTGFGKKKIAEKRVSGSGKPGLETLAITLLGC